MELKDVPKGERKEMIYKCAEIGCTADGISLYAALKQACIVFNYLAVNTNTTIKD